MNIILHQMVYEGDKTMNSGVFSDLQPLIIPCRRSFRNLFSQMNSEL